MSKTKAKSPAKLPKGGSVTAPPKVPDAVPGLSLFKIDEAMTIVNQLLAETGGEMTPEVERYYTELVQLASSKSDSYVSTILYMESQHEAAKKVMKTLEAKTKRWQNIADELRGRLAIFMGNQGIERIMPKDPTLPCVYLTKGKPKLEIDASKLPEGFYDVREERKPDRDAIDKALAGGADVSGVSKITGADYITIR